MVLVGRQADRVDGEESSQVKSGLDQDLDLDLDITRV